MKSRRPNFNFLRPILFTGVFPCALAGAMLPAHALEFGEAELYYELNNSDGDLGIHGSIDGGPYIELEIHDGKELTIGRLTAQGALAKQGLTQFFFESAEPKFSELSPRKFFQRFPEGEYEIVAQTASGQFIEAEVQLSQLMAAPVGNITVAGVPAAARCTAPNLPVVSAAAPIVIDWDPVTFSHPSIGKRGPVQIAEYQFFIQREGVKLALELPPDVTSFEVPASIIAMGNDFKFEIIARTVSGNNTTIESCFLVQ